jgi:hypothetical protein
MNEEGSGRWHAKRVVGFPLVEEMKPTTPFRLQSGNG